MKRRFRRNIEDDPTLREGYSRMLKHFVFWMNVPWVVMGACMYLGGIDYVWAFFRPQDGNVYVLIWHFTVYGLWALSAYWIFLRNGAEQLIKYPGFFNAPIKSISSVKFFTGLMLLGGILGVTMMYLMDIPVDQFPSFNE